MRLSFVGELGWELHIPGPSCVPVYQAVMAAGAKHGLVNAGYRAIDSLSIEKGVCRVWRALVGHPEPRWRQRSRGPNLSPVLCPTMLPPHCPFPRPPHYPHRPRMVLASLTPRGRGGGLPSTVGLGLELDLDPCLSFSEKVEERQSRRGPLCCLLPSQAPSLMPPTRWCRGGSVDGGGLARGLTQGKWPAVDGAHLLGCQRHEAALRVG